MKPEIESLNEITQNEITFRLTNTPLSIANGIRRTILSRIDTVVFITSPHKENRSVFIKNTTRFNNEILKQRLSCIPIHIKEFDNITNLEVHVNCENNSKDIQWVTTEHFEIYDTLKDEYLKQKEKEKIFPKNSITGSYIDFVRLRPKITDDIHGEHIQFIAKMSVSNAKHDSMFNVACNSSYGFTIDQNKADKAWNNKMKQLEEEGLDQDQIEFAKKDWDLLEAKRYYKENSYDFTIESVGVYTAKEIVVKACDILLKEFEEFKDIINKEYHDIVSISPANIKNSYDIRLNYKDNTFGKIIEYMLYKEYFEKGLITFCGFKIFHPHDTFGIIRLGFEKEVDDTIIKDMFEKSCNKIKNILEEIKKMFE